MSKADAAKRPLLLMVVNDATFFRSHRWPLALAAREAGWRVEVASAPDAALDWIGAQGIPAHPVPFRRKGRNPLNEIKTLVSLLRLYRRVRPDLIHHITIKPILYGGLAARILRIPAVVNAVTGLGYLFSKCGIRAWAAQKVVKAGYRLSLGYSRAVAVFQNPDDLRDIWGAVGHQRSMIIPGAGVDTAEFAFTEEPLGVPLVVLAARMLWSKGVGDFVDAARRCYVQGLAARFVLVGDSDSGNPEAVPVDVLRRWNAEGAIEWWGRREDMPEVLQQAHVVVLPTTYREGVPKVLIEAAAVGRPLIATDMPGCREIVCHNDNGLLIPPRDPEALATAIGELIADPVCRRRMGQRGRERVVEQFRLDKVLKETLDIYKRAGLEKPNCKS